MLFRNTLAQSTGMLAGYVFSFLLAPLMLSRLGLDKFGVWAVTGAVATYAGLLDLGVGRSLARFIAIYDAADRPERIRECVGFGLIVVAVVGIAALAVAAAIAPLLSASLGVLSTGEMRLVAMASVAIWTFNGAQGVLDAVGVGLRQMVPPNVAMTIGVTINFAFSVAALLYSTDLVVYAFANAAAALLAIGPCFFAMRYLWRRPYWAWPSRVLVKEVLVFSLKNQVGWIAELINFQTDKVVIAMAVDIRAAAVYEIASRVVIGVRSAAILTVSALIPTAAARIVEEGRGVVAQMYRRYTLRSCSISFPLFALSSAAAPFLLVAWLGEAPGDSELLVPFLTLAYAVNITTGVGSTIAIGAGHPGMVAANSLLIAAMNVVFTVALAPIFGLWGVVAGTFLALTAGSILFTWKVLRLFELPARDFLAGVLPTAALAVGLALPPAALSLLIGTPDGRVPAIAWLAVCCLIYLLPYWALASWRGYLPEKLQLPALRERGPVEAV